MCECIRAELGVFCYYDGRTEETSPSRCRGFIPKEGSKKCYHVDIIGQCSNEDIKNNLVTEKVLNDESFPDPTEDMVKPYPDPSLTSGDSHFEYKQDKDKVDFTLIPMELMDQIMECRQALEVGTTLGKITVGVRLVLEVMSVNDTNLKGEQWNKEKSVEILDDHINRLIELMETAGIDSLAELGKVYQYGATKKYKPDSWKKIPDAVRRVGTAILRHATDVYRHGIYAENEEDGGLLHVAQCLWGLYTLKYHVREGKDD